jgi:hypothetical protein
MFFLLFEEQKQQHYETDKTNLVSVSICHHADGAICRNP